MNADSFTVADDSDKDPLTALSLLRRQLRVRRVEYFRPVLDVISTG